MSKKDREYFTSEDELDPKTGRLKTVVTYIGEYFHTALTPGAFKRVKYTSLACAVANLALYTAAGFTSGRAGRSFITTLPYSVLLLPSVFMLWSVFRLFRLDGRFTIPDKKYTVDRILPCGYAIAAIGVWCAAAGVYYAVTPGEAPGQDAFFAIALFGCALLGLFLVRLSKRILLIKD